MAGDAVLIGQEATQEGQALACPIALISTKSSAPGQRGAQHQQQDLRQRIEHLAASGAGPRGRKMIQKAFGFSRLRHGGLALQRSLSSITFHAIRDSPHPSVKPLT